MKQVFVHLLSKDIEVVAPSSADAGGVAIMVHMEVWAGGMVDYQVCLGAYMRLSGTVKLIVQCLQCQTEVFRCYLKIQEIFGGAWDQICLANVVRSGERLEAGSVQECHGNTGRRWWWWWWLSWEPWCFSDVKTSVWHSHSFHAHPTQTQEPMWILKHIHKYLIHAFCPLYNHSMTVTHLSQASKALLKEPHTIFIGTQFFFLFSQNSV